MPRKYVFRTFHFIYYLFFEVTFFNLYVFLEMHQVCIKKQIVNNG